LAAILGSDHAAGAGAISDHDALTDMARQGLRHEPRRGVARAPAAIGAMILIGRTDSRRANAGSSEHRNNSKTDR